MTRLRRLAATALMLIAASSAWPQEPPRPAAVPIPRDGQPWRIEKIADIPPPLKSAIDHARCQLDEWILHEIPIQIFRPGRAAIALVTCESVVWYGRAFLFERNQGIEPIPMLFPTIARPSGIAVTDLPGVLVWDASTRTLTATQGNDVGGGDEFRHAYRYDPARASLFTLIRVETRKCCNEEAWTPIWDAPAWPTPHR